MVRQIGTQPITSRRTAVVMLAALGILFWHLLACTESPMAFSPNGKDLAFVTMEPYGENADSRLAGPHCYRLMVASNHKDLRVLEETTNAMLTAPAYSPDGAQMCYVRIPLLSTAQLRQLENASAKAKTPGPEGTESPATTQASSLPATAEAPWHTDDMALPDVGGMVDLVQRVRTHAPVKAELVIRQARDYSIIKTVPLDLQGLQWNTPKGQPGIFVGPPDIYMAYLTLRPQFSADGQWIYLCVGNVLVAVSPDRMTQQVLAAPAASAVLSPDGQTIAFLQEPAIGIRRTDGSKVTYVRWNGTPSLSGLAWVDNNTLAILSKGSPATSGGSTAPTTGEASEAASITFMRADGTILSSPRISLPATGDKEDIGELAISGNGRHIVVAFRQKVYFLDGQGRIVNLLDQTDKTTSQPGVKRVFVQPTFSPDSGSVAFKSMVGEEDHTRVDAIVYFSPDGKELSRVAIPRIRPGTTRPADETTESPSQPAE